jgi:hypothetical protein
MVLEQLDIVSRNIHLELLAKTMKQNYLKWIIDLIKLKFIKLVKRKSRKSLRPWVGQRFIKK